MSEAWPWLSGWDPVCDKGLQSSSSGAEGRTGPSREKTKHRKPLKEAKATTQEREMEGPHEAGGFGDGADSGLEKRC